MNELKPCPFCGGEIPAPTRKYMSVLICPTCNAYGPGNSDMTNDELIAAWNTRATLRSEREKALEELVRDMWREMITCPDYATSPCMTNSICERVRNLEIEVNR